jgi:hypothetical protein
MRPARPPAQPDVATGDVVVASHEALFAPSGRASCDACGVELEACADADDAVTGGQGTYLWVRGGEPTLEHVPLCTSCASAIGMTALARWEIEEEEG